MVYQQTSSQYMQKFILTIFSIFISNMCFVVLASDSGSNAAHYEKIEWTRLMPAEDLAILLNPPAAVLQIEDGMQDDNIESLDELSLTDPEVARYQQALRSSTTIKEFDQKRIGIPGFIVPIKADENQLVTEFFIVPYFGACLHLPPPPPNQIIFGRFKEGIQVETLYDPFWFEGKITIDYTHNPMGASAYTMKVNNLHLYQE